ncbi:MAG: hypothetical protein QOJ64_1346 [Acidobacteriota bacterium]|nr:hypothetical protein [Acidobacteriota bacterium]
MYMMPLSYPQLKMKSVRNLLLVFLVLVFAAVPEANAQLRRRRPATGRPTQQQGNANTTPQQKPQQKKITPLRSADTSEGSRITIRADAPLNDYSAYRSGDRYYVVIPEASAPSAQGGLRGRGFEDVKVQKRGSDTVLSFKLQPGTNARVSQRFDKLDVELTTPGGGGANTASTTGRNGTPDTTGPTTPPTPRQTPQPYSSSTTTPQTSTDGQITSPRTPYSTGAYPPAYPPTTTGSPAVVFAPTPDLSASPGANTAASPEATAGGDQIAQAQPPLPVEPSTSSQPATSSPTLGAVLKQNWLMVLIGALVLLSIVMIVAARSRAQRNATSATPRVRRRDRKRGYDKEAAELPERESSAGITAPSAGVAVPLAKAVEEAEDLAPAVVAVGAVEAVETAEVAEAAEPAEAEPTAVAAEEVTKEVEVAPAVDAERVDLEVKNALAGDTYDESVIGASDAGTRQLIATELLSALASRNIERRDRARDVFIKHNYLDEATRNLRTAEAPAERAAAARSLGYLKDRSTTPHLVAALEDEAPEVRCASVEALADLHDPSAAEPLRNLLRRERDRKVPKNLIKNAIEASSVIEVESVTVETEPPAVSAPEVPPADLAAGLTAASLVSAMPETDVVEDEAAAREREEEAARRRAEEEERERLEAERVRAEEEAHQAAEAARLAQEEADRKAEEERLAVEAEAQRRAEEEARLKAEAEARLRAEEEARLKAEEEARLRAEEEARLQAEEEARLRAEEEARLKAEEEARLQAEEEARLRAEEEARLKAEEETRLQAEEEARVRAEEEARLRLEEERRQADEAARLKAEEEAARWRAEQEAEQVRVAEEERQRAAEEARLAEAEMDLGPVVVANDGTPVEWVDVDLHETPVAQSREIQPSDYAIVHDTPAQPLTKEIEFAVSEKGIAPLDEFSTVPGVILKRLSSEEPTERAAAVSDLARVSGDDSFREISAAFDDPAVEVRNAAARSLFNLTSDRAATFTRALRESPPERRRKIGSALASSGLASEAIGQLMGESREKTYDAFSLLFLMSKAGEVQPLMRAIEEHPNNEVRLAVVKLLALSGQQDILPAFRRLAVRGSLPTEVRSAVMEAIYQISSQSPTPA